MRNEAVLRLMVKRLDITAEACKSHRDKDGFSLAMSMSSGIKWALGDSVPVIEEMVSEFDLADQIEAKRGKAANN